MHVILSNFNHERWMIVCTSLSAQRKIVEECLKWANQRVVFGKPLNAQPVIRAKLANMIARVEAGQNWLEYITHQMNNVSILLVYKLHALVSDPVYFLCAHMVGICDLLVDYLGL